MSKFKVKDQVQKISGYKWPGEVVSTFTTIKGEQRYVVECTTPEVAGALHIYSETQLELVNEGSRASAIPSLETFRITLSARGTCYEKHVEGDTADVENVFKLMLEEFKTLSKRSVDDRKLVLTSIAYHDARADEWAGLPGEGRGAVAQTRLNWHKKESQRLVEEHRVSAEEMNDFLMENDL